MDNILELEVTTTIDINIVDLITQESLNSKSSTTDIQDAVNDYIGGLDDCEFYLIGPKETEIIIKHVHEYLDNMRGEN